MKGYTIKIFKKFFKNIRFFKKKIKEKDINTFESESEIIIYFSGGMKQLYQIEQWLHPFQELNKYYKVGFVLRNKSVFNYLSKKFFNKFEIRYFKKLTDIITFYKKNNHKVILYVNNNMKNFQSLINNKVIHIHINHGESEKISTFSNQVKVYDYVFIVAQAALFKYKLNLSKINLDKFIQIGRPQIEYISPLNDFPKTDKKIVLYAPTWEGGYSDMNYSSIVKFGKVIIENLIKEDYFIVYKPHPYIGVRDKNYKDVQQDIIKLLKDYQHSYIMLKGNIIDLYPYVDISIFDNSATVIDYLSFDKPYIITEFKNNDTLKSMILYGGEILNNNNILDLKNIIKKNIKEDKNKEIRNKIKKYYLGDFNYSNQESTKKFIEEIGKIIKEREKLVSYMQEEQRMFNKEILNKIKEI